MAESFRPVISRDRSRDAIEGLYRLLVMDNLRIVSVSLVKSFIHVFYRFVLFRFYITVFLQLESLLYL